MPCRTSHPRQRRRSNAASQTTGTGTQGRPVTRHRTVDETAELLATSTRTIRRWIASGALSAYRRGRVVRIADEDIAVFLDANRTV
jgi:excisionase family DNA binding protein